MPEQQEYVAFMRPMGLAMDRSQITGVLPASCCARVVVNDQLCIPGTRRIRTSVLACWADLAAGAAANGLGGRVVLTADLTIRLVAPPVADEVTISAVVLKEGRTTSFAEAILRDQRGVTFALSHMTFQRSPRTQDVLSQDALPEFSSRAEPVPPSYPAPFFDAVGLRHRAPGVVELDRVPAVMNQAGTLQGGAVAALIEAAAEDGQGPVGDMEIHYLSAVRFGPGQATAVPLGIDGLTRVEVRDPGNDGRLATLGLVWAVRTGF